MKLKYRSDAQNPITSTKDFLQRRKEDADKFLEAHRSINEYWDQRKKEISDRYPSIAIDSDPTIKELHHNEYRVLSSEVMKRKDALSEWRRRTFDSNIPLILISCCPFCQRELWMQAGPMFSLTDSFWFRAYSDGRGDIVEDGSVCEHLFCIDGALNLNGHSPLEACKWHSSSMGKDWDYIWLASEVPFVKPRVMKLPGMVAVMTDFPVAEKYTAYPIVYFAKEAPYPRYREDDFCIPWATKAYVDAGVGLVANGNREDAQEYDLLKWLEQNKLYWLETQNDAHRLIRGTVETFPYLNLSGRQHPYKIVEGRVINLPRRDLGGGVNFRYSDIE